MPIAAIARRRQPLRPRRRNRRRRRPPDARDDDAIAVPDATERPDEARQREAHLSDHDAGNRLTLTAILATRGDLRHTPAGIPAFECTLDHRSTQREADGERKVECEMHAVAFGEVARQMSRVAAGSAVQCEGFLARRYRTGAAVAFHVTRFETRE